MITIPIAGPRPRGANHWQGAHWTRIHRARTDWHQATQVAWARTGRPRPPADAPNPKHIRATLPLTRWRSADPHNYTSYELKWIIDALVRCQVLDGDTADLVVVHDPTLTPLTRAAVPTTTVVVSWDVPCPSCGADADSGDPHLPAPYCSEHCLSEGTAP